MMMMMIGGPTWPPKGKIHYASNRWKRHFLPLSSKDHDDQDNDPTWSFGRGKTVCLSFVAQSVRLLGCRAKMLASPMMIAWVGRHAFRQVLMSLNPGRFLREPPEKRKNQRRMFSKMYIRQVKRIKTAKVKRTQCYTMA